MGTDRFQINEEVWSVEYSPDGKMLAVCGRSMFIHLFDARTGRKIRHLHCRTLARAKLGDTLAFSPDGRWLLAENPAQVWDVATGEVVSDLGARFNVAMAVDFSPDGRTVANIGCDEVLRLYDVVGKRRVFGPEGMPDGKQVVRFSPDGKTLALGFGRHGSGGAGIWDLESGKRLVELTGHEGEVRELEFTPDGTQLLTGCTDGVLRVFDVATGRGKEWLKSDRPGWVFHVDFHPGDGVKMATDFPGSVRVFDFATGKEQLRLPVHTNGCRDLDFSPDGKTLAVASARSSAPWFFDLATGKRQFTEEGHSSVVSEIAFLNEDRLVSLDESSVIYEWDLRERSPVRVERLPGHDFSHVVLSPDGSRVAWVDAVDKKLVRHRRVGDPDSTELAFATGGGTRRLSFSPDSRHLLVCEESLAVQVKDLDTGARMSFKLPAGYDRSSPAVAADGRTVAACDKQKTLSLFDAKTGTETRKIHGLHGRPLRFSPDGTSLFVGGLGRSLPSIWDMRSGRLRRLSPGARAHTAEFSPDGSLFWTWSDNRAEVLVWEAASGKLLAEVKSTSRKSVNSVSVSPRGKRVAYAVGASVYVAELR